MSDLRWHCVLHMHVCHAASSHAVELHRTSVAGCIHTRPTLCLQLLDASKTIVTSLMQVMSALHMIMAKWKGEGVFRDLELDPENVQLRMIMLGKLCGAVIGEGGKTINEIKEATNTDIRIQVRMHADSPWPRLHRSQTRAVHPLQRRSNRPSIGMHCLCRQGCMHCRLPMRTRPDFFAPVAASAATSKAHCLACAWDDESAAQDAMLMQSRDDCVRGVQERIITIIGSENYLLQAVGRILKQCLEDPAYEEYRSQSMNYAASSGSLMSGMQVCVLCA